MPLIKSEPPRMVRIRMTQRGLFEVTVRFSHPFDNMDELVYYYSASGVGAIAHAIAAHPRLTGVRRFLENKP